MTTMRVSPHWQCVVVFFPKEGGQAPFTLKLYDIAPVSKPGGRGRPFNPLGSKDMAGGAILSLARVG